MMQERIQHEWMTKGVTIVDPGTVWIESGARIGADTSIYPFSFVGCGSVIGDGCRIGPYGHVASGETVHAGAHVGPALWAGT